MAFSLEGWRSALSVALHGLGFVATTLLISWGLFILLFLMLGGFSLDGLIHQLNNLTARYVVAEAARRGSFLNMFAIAHVILSTAVVILRRHHLLPARSETGAPRHG